MLEEYGFWFTQLPVARIYRTRTRTWYAGVLQTEGNFCQCLAGGAEKINMKLREICGSTTNTCTMKQKVKE